MFEGEKRALFWIGLVVLALASIILFATWWQFQGIDWYFAEPLIRQSIPIIVGAVVFILIGLYMIKSGVKKP